MRLGPAQQRAWQGHRLGIALCRQPLDRRAARIAKAQNLGGLVERLAQRIVDGRREAAVPPDPRHHQQLAMPARDQQQQIGKLQRRIGQPRRQGVALKVIDRDQRLAACHRQRLGGDQADHNPADQSRPGRGGNGIDIGEGQPGIGQRAGDQRCQQLRMGARGDFGNDPAIGAVRVVLRGDALRQDHAFAGDQRSGGFVARRFNAQNECHPRFHLERLDPNTSSP